MQSAGLTITYSSVPEADRSPDLRLIHFNDVYHVEYAKPLTKPCVVLNHLDLGRRNQLAVSPVSNPL